MPSLCFAARSPRVYSSLIAISLAVSLAAQTTSTWNNSTGNWSDASRWSPNSAFPNNNGGLTFNAVISGGTATLTESIIVNQLTQSGSSVIRGPFDLTATSGATLSAGTQTGAGTTTLQGTSAISGGIFLDGGRTLRNEGALTWSAGILSFNSGDPGSGNILNAAGGTFTASSSTALSIQSPIQSGSDVGTDALFTNAGTFVKAGTGTTTIGTLFNNTGTVSATGGTVTLNGGGVSTGTFTAASGATVALGVGTHTITGGTVSGAGTFQNSGGTNSFTGTYAAGGTSITGGRFDLNSNGTSGTFSQSGGGTLGGTGTLTVTGAATLSAGTQTGAGTTTLQGTSAISGGIFLDGGRTLRNEGALTWSAGILSFNSGDPGSGNILNAAGGTFTASSSTTLSTQSSSQGGSDLGTDALFTNAGTFVKAGAGTTTISTLFNNTGTVNATGGTLTVTGDVTQHSGTTLTGGTWFVGAGATLNLNETGAQNLLSNAGDVTLSGAGSTFARINSLTSSSGAFRLLANRSFTTAGSFANTGVLQLGGGTFALGGVGTALTNSSTAEIFGFGTLSPRPTNSGVIRAAGGTLAIPLGIQGGSGTVQIDPGATLTLGAASSADFLIHNGNTAGSLALGANDFTVTADYTNANWGSGNSFAPRTNISGTGLILAGGNTAQALTGATVTGGTTATATIALPAIREGEIVTRSYTIQNSGSLADSPALRGALQTNTGGGNLTDARLGGTGATAANFGPIAVGAASGALDVTLTGTVAGALAANQTVAVVNNFDNVAEQTITVTTPGVYRIAIFAPAAPNPVTLASVREGTAFTAATFGVSNPVVDVPGYTESLSVVLGSPTAGLTASGTAPTLAPGASAATAYTVNLTDSATAGTKTGTVGLTGTSLAVAGSGLSDLSLGAQTVTVNGNVYRAAVFAPVTANPVTLANVREGTAFTPVALTVGNSAVNIAGYTESLAAGFTGAQANVSAAGSIASLAPSTTNNSALTVALTDTSVAGAKTGTVGVAGTSLALVGSGLSDLSLGTQTVTINGEVYRAAVFAPVAPNPVTLASVREGTAFTAGTFGATNAAVNIVGYTESLAVALGTPGAGVTAAGDAITLAPEASNTAAFSLNLTDTTTAGAKTGTVDVVGTSLAVAGSGLSNLALGTQAVTINGNVYRAAVFAPVTANPLALASVREGAAFTPVALTVGNSAVNIAGYTESLAAGFTGAQANVSASGSIAALAPSGTNNSALTVALTDTATAGAKSGTVGVAGTSVAVAGSGLSDLALGTQTVTVNGNVYRAAVFAPVTANPVTLASVREGAAFAPVALTVGNSAVNVAGYTESLAAGFTSAQANVSAAGSIATLAPSATNNSTLTVALTDTATAGAKTGTVGVTGTSVAVAGSGLSDLALGTQTVTVNGNVYRAAVFAPVTANPVTLASVRENATFTPVALTIGNSAADIPGYTETLETNLASGSAGVAVETTGITQTLAPGTSTSTAYAVTLLDTATAGVKAGTLDITGTSLALAGSGLSDLPLGTQTVTVSGNVYRAAVFAPVTVNPVTLASVREGAAFTPVALTVGNSAVNIAGYTESLSAGFTGAQANVSASGSITSLTPSATNNSELTVALTDTATAGAKTGTVGVAGTSLAVSGSGLSNLSLGTQTLTVNGNVYRAAVFAPVSANPVTLASVRENTAFTPVALTVGNSAVNVAGYTESLAAGFTGAQANVSASGSITSLAPSATNDSALTVALTDTATAGAKSGTVGVTGTSVAVAGSGLSDLALGTQTVTVNGNVYRAASTNTQPATLSLGTVRVGSAAPTSALTVLNTAANIAGYTESLSASVLSAGGPLNTTGSVTGLIAGASSAAISVSLPTVTAGVFSDLPVSLGFTSQAVAGSGLGNLALAGQTVLVSGTVNNLAVVSLSQISGVGVLTFTGPNSATLDFGTVIAGTTSPVASLQFGNGATGPADALGGSFGINTTAFVVPTLAAFNGLAAGASLASFNVSLSTDNNGVFNDTFQMSGLSQNAFQADAALSVYTVTLTASVIPEPSTWAFAVGTAALALAAGRRSRRAAR